MSSMPSSRPGIVTSATVKTAAGDDVFRLLGLIATESIGQPFVITIDLTADNDDIKADTLLGTPTVIVGGLPVATLTSTGMCAVPPPCVMAVGSATVLVGAIPAMAMAKQSVHGGMIVQGQPTVIIGG